MTGVWHVWTDKFKCMDSQKNRYGPVLVHSTMHPPSNPLRRHRSRILPQHGGHNSQLPTGRGRQAIGDRFGVAGCSLPTRPCQRD